MNFIPTWAPSIHPMLVHFPIVLLIFALLFDVMGLIWKEHPGWRRAGLLLYGFGGLAIIAVYLSGKQAAGLVQVPDNVIPAISDHYDWATRALWFWMGFVVLRFGLALSRWGSRRLILGFFVLAGLAGNYLIYETADHGAKLVYLHGVGVKAAALNSQSSQKSEKVFPGSFRASEREISWEIGNDALAVLRTRLDWRNVPEDGVSAELLSASDGPVLAIHLKNARSVVLFPEIFKDVSLSAQLNLEAFDGSVLLVTHFSGQKTFNFLRAEKNALVLGRSSDDQVQKWAQKSFALSGWQTLKIVSTNGHFRGYADDALILHGHNTELQPGKTGLVISGNGTVKLRAIKAVSLQGESH